MVKRILKLVAALAAVGTLVVVGVIIFLVVGRSQGVTLPAPIGPSMAM